MSQIIKYYAPISKFEHFHGFIIITSGSLVKTEEIIFDNLILKLHNKSLISLTRDLELLTMRMQTHLGQAFCVLL